MVRAQFKCCQATLNNLWPMKEIGLKVNLTGWENISMKKGLGILDLFSMEKRQERRQFFQKKVCCSRERC